MRRWSTRTWPSGRIGWFLGGRLNVSANCLDRHLAQRGDKTALLWEGDEPGDNRRVTYAELHEQVCRLANALRGRGIGKGDRVAIYMGMVPELAVAMLACARIGAVHSVIFGGFSAQSIADRIADSACAAVITQDEGRRGGRVVPLKANVDAALEQTDSVRFVIVYQRADGSAPMQAGRDVWWDEAVGAESSACEPVSMDAEDPLFILYTSGSTGKPKGVLHTQAGYLLYATMTHKYVFDLREDDIYCCAADIGWVTGHSYIVYGPLSNGATSVMFESIPTYPDAGRYWDMVDRLRITSFYTAPTAIRAIAREGDAHVTRYRRTSLRVLGSVGEPINPEAWRWYFQVVGEGRAAIVDTYWQTETGGHMITGLPGAITMKPGSASVPFFGVQPVIVDPEGREIEGNNVSGLLCMAASWPGMMRTIYGDHDRFIQTYLSQYPGKYFTGDGAYRDHDGYYWLTGRVDDVLNVSGHRIGTAEVEGALVQHEACAEAAVVGYPARREGRGNLRLRAPDRGGRAVARAGAGDAAVGANGDRPHRDAGQAAVRAAGPAQDPLGQDHAPHPAQGRRGGAGERRRRDDAGRPQCGRGHRRGGGGGLLSARVAYDARGGRTPPPGAAPRGPRLVAGRVPR